MADRTVDWTAVQPGRGLAGALDRFFGPGATGREWAMFALGAVAACGGLACFWVTSDALASFPFEALVWAFVVSADVFGGIMTNATNTAKRWYHPIGVSGHGKHLGFVVAHIVHLGAIAFLVLPLALNATAQHAGAANAAASGDAVHAPWLWFVVNIVLLYALGAAVEFTRLDIQRPLAFAALLIAIFVNSALVPLPPVLAYFVPLFYLKIFVCYLTVEAPWRTRAQ